MIAARTSASPILLKYTGLLLSSLVNRLSRRQLANSGRTANVTTILSNLRDSLGWLGDIFVVDIPARCARQSVFCTSRVVIEFLNGARAIHKHFVFGHPYPLERDSRFSPQHCTKQVFGVPGDKRDLIRQPDLRC